MFNKPNKIKYTLRGLLLGLPVLFELMAILFHIKIFYRIVLLLVIAMYVAISFIMFCRSFSGKIKIKTPDGSDEPYHPSVIYFKNGWNGFKYWMAFTPFPIKAMPYHARWECPCVIASNDGKKWSYPKDMAFIDDLKANQISHEDYFSDTHLLYDDNSLYCYYRLSTGEGDYKNITLFRKKTVDGINWGDREKLSFDFDITNEFRLASPSILKIDGRYLMWFVAANKKPRKLCLASSNNGIEWNYERECILHDEFGQLWHVDCQYIDNKYYLVEYDLNEVLTIWESLDGISFSYTEKKIIPNYKVGSFYSKTLYRSCLVKDDHFSLYFSSGNGRKHSVGLMQGDTIQDMKVVSCSKIDYRIFILDMIDALLFPFHSIYIKFSGLFKEKKRN
jgi:hypothetical protein